MGEDHIISQKGYNKLQDELKQLTNVKRKDIADRIEKAKELGDLSENAEYHEAKDAQSFNEGRIIEVNNILKNATVVESDGIKGEIAMGSTFTVLNSKTKKEREFTIVSFNEADPLEGKISNESPLGTAFLNKKKNDELEVETPRGLVKYKVIDIK